MIWYGRSIAANDTLSSTSLYFEDEPVVLYESFARNQFFSLEDFDRDGTIDIAFSTSVEGRIFLNTGGRQYEDIQFFQYQNTTRYADEMWYLERFWLTDVNGDNYTDILMMDSNDFDLYVATQEPPSMSSLSSTDYEISFRGEHGDERFLRGGEFSLLHTADMDGDGLEEVLYTLAPYQRDLNIYMVQPSYTYPPSSQPSMAPTMMDITSNAEHLYSGKWSLLSWHSMMCSIVVVTVVVF